MYKKHLFIIGLLVCGGVLAEYGGGDNQYKSKRFTFGSSEESRATIPSKNDDSELPKPEPHLPNTTRIPTSTTSLLGTASDKRALGSKHNTSQMSSMTLEEAKFQAEQQIRVRYPSLGNINFNYYGASFVSKATNDFLKINLSGKEQKLKANLFLGAGKQRFSLGKQLDVFTGSLDSPKARNALKRMLVHAIDWSEKKQNAAYRLEALGSLGKVVRFSGDFNPLEMNRWVNQLERISKEGLVTSKISRIRISNLNPRLRHSLSSDIYLNSTLNLRDDELKALIKKAEKLALDGKRELKLMKQP